MSDSFAALTAELEQATVDLEHLRQLVSERRANGAALCVAEYRVVGLRRRLLALTSSGDTPPGTDGAAG